MIASFLHFFLTNELKEIQICVRLCSLLFLEVLRSEGYIEEQKGTDSTGADFAVWPWLSFDAVLSKVFRNNSLHLLEIFWLFRQAKHMQVHRWLCPAEMRTFLMFQSRRQSSSSVDWLIDWLNLLRFLRWLFFSFLFWSANSRRHLKR